MKHILLSLITLVNVEVYSQNINEILYASHIAAEEAKTSVSLDKKLKTTALEIYKTNYMSVNKVILIGHVGQDPEVRVAGEHKVATFSLATTERGYTLANGTQVPERTEWHNIVLWRGLAEIAEKYVKKGDKLYIEGKIKTRSYDDKKGAKRYITEIFADNLEMLGGKTE